MACSRRHAAILHLLKQLNCNKCKIGYGNTDQFITIPLEDAFSFVDYIGVGVQFLTLFKKSSSIAI